MKQCKTCKWWQKLKHWPEGRCRTVRESMDFEIESECSCDYPFVSSVLTKEDFGCTLHTPRPDGW